MSLPAAFIGTPRALDEYYAPGDLVRWTETPYVRLGLVVAVRPRALDVVPHGACPCCPPRAIRKHRAAPAAFAPRPAGGSTA